MAGDDASPPTVHAGIAVIVRDNEHFGDVATDAFRDASGPDPERGGRVQGGDVEVLITQRPEGTPKAGSWEFPGGKIEPGETGRACVERETLEEVGVSVNPFEQLTTVEHTYDHARVVLDVWLCRLSDAAAEPRPIEVSDLRWVRASELPVSGFLEGNGPIIAALLAWVGR
jgi:mutator protein MutT